MTHAAILIIPFKSFPQFEKVFTRLEVTEKCNDKPRRKIWTPQT